MGRGKVTRGSTSSTPTRRSSAAGAEPLVQIPMRNQTSPLRTVKFWFEAGELILNQPYQRGHVWEEPQKLALVKSILQGIPIGGVYLNRRAMSDTAGYYVVDGKQRLRAINDFLTGKVRFPAAWIEPQNIAGTPDADGNIAHDDLDEGFRRALSMNATFSVHETSLPDEDAERELFDRINFTGTPMTDSDRATS